LTIYSRVVILVSLVCIVLPPRARAQNDQDGWHPTAIEAMMLPKFCWGQFMKNRFRGPEFRIQNCGPGMNHYCPALVALNRANRSFDSRTKRGYLQGARAQALYTVKAMEKYPYCPIRGQVDRTYQQIERELGSLR